MAHGGIRIIALLFFAHRRRRELGISVRTRSLFTPGIDAIPIVKGAVWAPVEVWRGAEIFDNIAILSTASINIVSRHAHYDPQPYTRS
jgi:hypothetical protein